MTNEQAKSELMQIYMSLSEEKKQALDVLMAIPSAEPKTGHWEWMTEDKYRCSNCNYETRVDECMNKPMYDFCPFCGVKMVQVESEE